MITVLGASGFVGSEVVRHLVRSGAEFDAPPRDADLRGRNLGRVLYCIGLTADFRERPYDAVDAHVCKLLEVVRHCTFESLVYLSSTRLYIRNEGVAHEDDDLRVNPLDFEDIYNLSKATGESIVLSLGNRGRVARLSNVYGADQKDTFVSMILEEARTRGTITLRTALDSEKDYISVADAAMLLVKIALDGRERIYNVVGGYNLTNGEVTAAIAKLTGCTVTVVPDAPAVMFPRLDNSRARREFGFTPARLLDDLPSLIGRNE
ncbi:MAG TPA: NAD(P)-dependent oxidoreductase [Thermoanaerobaculia bacterium]|nr:NAD(P)-dependent oxidoreductase [Thermoanaerobaculia bacterium]